MFVPLQQEACASMSSSSSQRPSSSESFFPRRNGESTFRMRPEEKASRMRGGYGSETTSPLGTPPRFVIMHKNLPNRWGDKASREVSPPQSIPLSPNYFDVQSEAEEAPPEETPLLVTHLEFPDLQRAMALS